MELSLNKVAAMSDHVGNNFFQGEALDFDPRSSFVLASNREMLIASGVNNVLPAGTVNDLAESASTFFRQLDPHEQTRLIVGALPFKHAHPAHLFQPSELQRLSGESTHLMRELSHSFLTPPASHWQVTAEPSRVKYARNVTRALALLEQPSPELEKVVLARSLTLRANTEIDPRRIFARLCADRSVTSYSVPLNTAGNRLLVGATPELLLAKSGARVTSRPLAGSARRHIENRLDREAGQALSRSEKDLREHLSVRESILDSLAPYCRQLKLSDRPFLVSTATMWHLATEIEGELRDDQTSSLELAVALHPSAAVCGMPRDIASNVIGQLEEFDRGFFSGAVGWCDQRGDGEWFVAIRCAEVSGNFARLYAGAGIVAGSDPEAEASETSVKFRALLDALGVEQNDF